MLAAAPHSADVLLKIIKASYFYYDLVLKIKTSYFYYDLKIKGSYFNHDLKMDPVPLD